MKSYFSVFDKTTVASCLGVSKNTCLFIIFTPQTFPIIILIIITPVSEFVISLTVILHTTYLTRQEVDQTFITTCKSMLDFINLLMNKRLKYLNFYNFFENFSKNAITFPRPKQSLLTKKVKKAVMIRSKLTLFRMGGAKSPPPPNHFPPCNL